MLKLTIEGALQRLKGHPKPFIRLFQHGTLEVEIYKPEKLDMQTPHGRDEVYIVATGSGEFELAGERQPVGAGDVLFAPAAAPHRFLNFSDDFSTWVVFYGPEGGEQDDPQ